TRRPVRAEPEPDLQPDLRPGDLQQRQDLHQPVLRRRGLREGLRAQQSPLGWHCLSPGPREPGPRASSPASATLPPMADLKGRTLFITGGSRGIGLAIALRAAADG